MIRLKTDGCISENIPNYMGQLMRFWRGPTDVDDALAPAS